MKRTLVTHGPPASSDPVRPPAPCHPAWQQSPDHFRRYTGLRDHAYLAGRVRAEIPGGRACLCADGQSFSPLGYANRYRSPAAHDAGGGAQLRAALQPAPWPERHAVGRALPRHAHYLGVRNDRLVTPHALYWALGNTPFAREAAYGDLVQAGVADDHQRQLTDATLRGWALGEPTFIEDLQKKIERRVSRAPAGRPPAGSKKHH